MSQNDTAALEALLLAAQTGDQAALRAAQADIQIAALRAARDTAGSNSTDRTSGPNRRR
jgi:hypothetical protein